MNDRLCSTPRCENILEPFATDGGDEYRTRDEGGRCAPCNEIARVAKLRTVRGTDGWTLHLIEDDDESRGIAVLEKLGMRSDFLAGGWTRASGEATVLTVEPWGPRPLSVEYMGQIEEALADAAVSQLASWGIDAFQVE